MVGFPSKSSILIGFSIINHPFWDTPIFGNTHIGNCTNVPAPSSRKVLISSNLDGALTPLCWKVQGVIPLLLDRDFFISQCKGPTKQPGYERFFFVARVFVGCCVCLGGSSHDLDTW